MHGFFFESIKRIEKCDVELNWRFKTNHGISMKYAGCDNAWENDDFESLQTGRDWYSVPIY